MVRKLDRRCVLPATVFQSFKTGRWITGSLEQSLPFGSSRGPLSYTYIHILSTRQGVRQHYYSCTVDPVLFPSGNPFKCHEEVLYLQPLIPPKRFDIFPPD
ncbi:unnamed protein product [Ascophyllum nodosum]